MHKSRHFQDFAEFRDHVLSTFLDYYPTLASWLGLHQYDVRIEDFSAARRGQYLQAMLEARDWIETRLSGDHPDKTTHFECRALEWKINDEIFRLTELRDFEWNPMV